MPPKKSKSNQEVTKKTPKKCPYNNRGYCKSKEECENRHTDKVCEDLDCIENNCDKRHPNPCKYGSRCGFKKKNECMYLHDTSALSDWEITALNQRFKNKFEKLENYVKKVVTDLEKKDSEIEHLKEKLVNLENTLDESQINVLKKDVETKNAQIVGLELRLGEIEKGHQAFKKHQEKKMKELENVTKQKAGGYVAEANVYKENNFKCRECDFTTSSRPGLKIHKSKTHSKINFEEFPAACNICEKVLDNEVNLKKHKKSEHTFHDVKYQCDECEFMANQVETLHVHFGIHHSDKKQCGLCDKDFNTSKQLEDHQTKCQIFMCSNSNCRDTFETLEEMKEHINDEHRKTSPAHYQFSYWILNTKDKSEKEVSKKYHTIYPKDW